MLGINFIAEKNWKVLTELKQQGRVAKTQKYLPLTVNGKTTPRRDRIRSHNKLYGRDFKATDVRGKQGQELEDTELRISYDFLDNSTTNAIVGLVVLENIRLPEIAALIREGS